MIRSQGQQAATTKPIIGALQQRMAESYMHSSLHQIATHMYTHIRTASVTYHRQQAEGRRQEPTEEAAERRMAERS